MEDKDLVPVVTIEDTTRRLNYLAVAGAREFFGTTATLWMIGELFDVTEDPFDKLRGRNRILQCNVISDCIQIRQG
jgi:hypothetical protein